MSTKGEKMKKILFLIATVFALNLVAGDVASIYTKNCKVCNGNLGQKKAFGKSAVIGAWSAPQIEEALLKYKNDKSYGRSMKKTMQQQAKKLTDSEIKTLAQYIDGLM